MTDELRSIDDRPPELPFLEYRGLAGRGGTATVWRAWHKALRRNVAVKVLFDSLAHDPDSVDQFVTEGRTMAYMDHPSIVHGYGVEQIDGRCFYLMDWVGGYSLARYLETRPHMREADVITVIGQVASALQYAWDTFQTVHCDIKPDNLMIDVDGTVKITDLGLASETLFAKEKESSQTDDIELVGTPPYMSPEQIWGDRTLDCRTDIYSLGATAYHLATGRTLFPGLSAEDVIRSQVDVQAWAPDPRLFVPTLSQGFVNLLACMLVKDRDRRFYDWSAVIDACQRVEDGEVLARPSAVSSVNVEQRTK